MRKLKAPAVFFLIFLAFLAAARFEGKRRELSNQQTLDAKVSVLQATLDKELGQRLRNVYGILAFVAGKPDLSEADFISFTQRLLPTDEGLILNLALIRDTTILYQYPKDPNASSIGVDLSQVPDQAPSVLRTKEQERTILVGPVDLVQGGQGLIFRLPILLDDDTYWGQLSLVIDYDALIDHTDLEGLEVSHHIILYTDISRYKILYRSETAPKNPKLYPLNLGLATWYLGVSPKVNPGPDVLALLLTIAGLFFGLLVAYGIHRMQRQNVELEERVRQRTQALEGSNASLKEALDNLHETQEQLILTEKLAALGDLVAGVAHEINTPLGIAVTLSTHLEEVNRELRQAHQQGVLTKSVFEEQLEDTAKAIALMSTNLQRASDLIASFKSLASDQHNGEERKIDLGAYLEEILLSLKPQLKGTRHELVMHLPRGLETRVNTGALSTVITNLFTNALVHGLREREAGHISVEIRRDGPNLLLMVADNGTGIPETIQDKVFMPFFTTGRQRGSTGIGLHLVYNAVVAELHGKIRFETSPEGTTFIVSFPAKNDLLSE